LGERLAKSGHRLDRKDRPITVVPRLLSVLVANPEGIRDDAAQVAGAPEMAECGSERTSGTTPPVFISYASQDAGAAAVLVEALERRGIACWIAPRDVKPGAQYADAIVGAINEARAVVLLLSQHAGASSHVGREVERAASKHKPIIAFRIDAATLTRALEYFLSESQWIEAQAGDIDAAHVKLIDAIRDLAPDAPAINPPAISGMSAAKVSAAGPALWRKPLVLTAVFAALVALAGLLVDRLWISKHVSQEKPAAPLKSPAFTPPPHSIAVLPFVNMSGDKDQEYFSEGLTEELLNSLSRINELQVAARTSSFSFQGEHPDIATVAHRLNVGAVLEGSVRRSANTVRITAQLVNGVTGFHIWSQTYDRDLGDVLKLQTEIATAVASALKVTLLGDEAAKIEVGGTRNPAAFDAYLRATKAYWSVETVQDQEAVIADYTETIRLDPDYALAYAGRSFVLANYGWNPDAPRTAIRGSSLDKAQADARKAIALAPGLAEGHLALASLFGGSLDFTRAIEEFERALALAPGSARVLRDYGAFAVAIGRNDFGLTSLRRAVVLDPLNVNAYSFLGNALLHLRRYEEFLAVAKHAKAFDPDKGSYEGSIGIGYYLLGDFQAARAHCEANGEKDEDAQFCLAVTYDKLGRHSDAEAMLEKIRARVGDSGAMDYSRIYAQWGSTTKALEWLETAMQLHDPALLWLKLDPFSDSLRKESRFQAIERALKFPRQ
jgi:TolB-like protein